MTTFEPGTTFHITVGPVCHDNLRWWEIERYGTVGWVTAALTGEYLLEPYAGPMTSDATEPPLPETPLELQPEVPPPAVLSGCENALPARLAIGTSAMVLADSLRPHNDPAGEVMPQRWYLAGTGVTVTTGPECSGGQYWWLVTGNIKIGRIGNRSESVQGWVSEGSGGTYFIAP